MSARLKVTVLVTLMVGSVSMTQAGTIPIVEYPVQSTLGPGPITASGEVWFALPNDDKVGQISSTGKVTLYDLPPPYEEPRGITSGPNDTVWFTEAGGHSGGEGIASITQSGAITSFPVPAGTHPLGITLGPDGNLWFTTGGFPYQIGQMTPSGSVTIFPATLDEPGREIVTGPDGNLWFTEDGFANGSSGVIGIMTTSGTLTEYTLPTDPGRVSAARGITVGPDGNLWFTWTEAAFPASPPFSGSIGRITPTGTITRFPLPPGGDSSVWGITRGPDGNVWFTNAGGNTIGKITVAGVLDQFPIPSANSLPIGITVGGDGNLWFAEANASKIGRIFLNPPVCLGNPATQTGTVGSDTLTGTGGADVLVGLGGNDRIKGKGGADRVCAGDGKDKVSGGGGKDRLNGEDGKDTLKGGPGNDRLVGGPKRDTCNGGPGRDRASSCERRRQIP